MAEQVELMPGYSITWSGQYEYLLRAKERLQVVVPLTLLIIVLLLYLNFRNIVEVLIIMGTLPLALVGGVWLLYLLDYNLSVAVGVGFIALAGVAVEIMYRDAARNTDTVEQLARVISGFRSQCTTKRPWMNLPL